MPDPVDLATDHIEREAAAREELRRARQAAGPAPVYIDGQPTCAECGNDLPAARAAAGRGRCVECQDHHERNGGA